MRFTTALPRPPHAALQAIAGVGGGEILLGRFVVDIVVLRGKFRDEPPGEDARLVLVNASCDFPNLEADVPTGPGAPATRRVPPAGAPPYPASCSAPVAASTLRDFAGPF